jgi:predicted DNA-binding transcriptional regulator YafY
MDRTERFYKIDRLLSERRCVPMDALIETLGTSKATVKRDLEYLKDRLHAPIVWDRALRGYRYDASEQGASGYKLPGLWFSAAEIHALLTLQQLLANLGDGLLKPHIQPLLARLEALLESRDATSDEVRKRIRILHMAARPTPLAHFETVASATLKRRRLRIRYRARSSGAESWREISPQRLVHYRDNWYLDAWCHVRNALRVFAVDAIGAAEMLERAAKAVSERRLDAELAGGYGIFAGKQLTWARLRFTPARARWVSVEQWHPQQRGWFEADGSWLLELPYSAEHELLMDILRHGPEVEVLSPPRLRTQVREQLEAAASRYAV